SRGHVTLPAITRRFVTTKQRFYAYRGFMTVFTVGHGTRPIEELVETLAGAGVRTLVDVRRFPGSRRNPQYNQTPLAAAVEAARGEAVIRRLGPGRRVPDRLYAESEIMDGRLFLCGSLVA